MTHQLPDRSPPARWAAAREAMLRAEGSSGEPCWSADGAAFRGRGRDGWVFVEPDTQRSAEPVVDPDRLVAGLHAYGVDLVDQARSTMVVETRDRASFQAGGRWFRMALPSHLVAPMDAAEADDRARREPRLVRPAPIDDWAAIFELVAPGGGTLLTECGADLALRHVVDDRVRLLTTDGEPLFAWQLHGAAWSPDGSQVFARRTDFRGVPPIPVLHYLGDIEQVEYARPYAKTGAGPLRHEYALVDVPSGQQRPVLQDAGDGAFVQVLGWRGEELLVHHVDVLATQQTLLAIDRRTGTGRSLLSEPISLSGAMFLRRGQARRAAVTDVMRRGSSWLLWPSERTGFNHWYLVDLDNPTDCRQITSGPFDAEEMVYFDEADNVLFFLARCDPNRPYDSRLCRSGPDDGQQIVLSLEPGDHEVVARPDGAYFVDTWSSVTDPPRTVVRDRAGSEVSVIPGPVSVRDPVADTIVREVTVTAADGRTPLSAVVYLPPGYTADGSYPIVDVIYGGPQLPVRPTRFDHSGSSRAFDGEPVLRGAQARMLAQLGFITLVVDNTGTPGRGVCFQEVVRHRMGQVEIPDHTAAVHQIAARVPGADLSRVGITGRSWGGYLVVRAMLTAPDLYRVAVADAPAADHHDHIGHLAFAIMGLPADNPDGYAGGSNLLLADRLRGKLLILHGTSDLSATPSGSMKLVDAFVSAGRPVDQFFFPEGTHHPRGQRRYYLEALTARYLIEHLRPEGVGKEDIPLLGPC